MVLEERVSFRESQLIKKAELYKRWACEPYVTEPHTTIEEIEELCENGSLRTFSHIKGPIKGIIYCLHVAGVNSFDGIFYDEHVSYFLLEDVERCEKQHPDFLGNPDIGNTTLDDDPFADFVPPDPQEAIPVENAPKEADSSRNKNVVHLPRVIPATEVAKRWGLGSGNIEAIVRNSGHSL